MSHERLSIGRVLVLLLGVALLFQGSFAQGQESPGLRVATFDIDATPPVGSKLAYDPVSGQWDLGLRARGIVLLGAGEPIVLCAIDWIGIANTSHDAFRQTLADAAGTTPERVAVHTLHQHDAPACDFLTAAIADEYGLTGSRYDNAFAHAVIADLGQAVQSALEKTQPVTHVGIGEAEVFKVASNRRILGPDGKVRITRYTTCRNPKVRAEPEGTIDKMVSVVSLWNEERPLAVLSHYAVHPQSYYRTGIPNPDFPGVARFFRQLAVPDALHIHFSGAGGNLGAGKYNDGAHENRLILAERLADGMRRAWETTKKQPLDADAVAWRVCPVSLPLAPHLTVEALEATMKNEDAEPSARHRAAHGLAWLRRRQDGHQIEVSCLALGSARLLHLPGELFVEYQLAARAARPDLHVATAAYGDYAPGYICTEIAYTQGGYEAGASRTAPETEAVLMAAITTLLEK